MTFFEQVRDFLKKRTDGERQALGIRAERWLEDETLNIALAMLYQAAENKWLQSKDPEVRERAWFEVHRISAFKNALRRLVQDGKIITEREARHADRQRGTPTQE